MRKRDTAFEFLADASFRVEERLRLDEANSIDLESVLTKLQPGKSDVLSSAGGGGDGSRGGAGGSGSSSTPLSKQATTESFSNRVSSFLTVEQI